MGSSVALWLTLVLLLLGGGLIATQILLGRTRRYFLYLGIICLIFAIMMLLPSAFRLPALIVQGILIILSIYEAIKEMQDRVQRIKVDQQQREEAFSDYLKALADKEKQ